MSLHRFLHSEGAGSSYTPPTLAPRPMDFFQLQARFWQLHEVEYFSPVETMLYQYWLNRFNIGNGPQDRWPGSLTRKVTDVADDLGLTENTVAKARTGLEKRGLLCYRAGNKTRIAAWGLDPVAFNIDLKNSGQSVTIDRNISGQYTHNDLKNSGQSEVIDLKNSGPYKEENIVVKTVKENTPNPSAGVGELSSKKNEDTSSQLSSPSQSLILTSANSGGAALDDSQHQAARTLAAAIAQDWQISEARNFQKWAKIFRFAILLTASGQFDELASQFTAYAKYRQLRGISAYNLDKYLGSELHLSPQGWPYSNGEWCGCDWAAKLAEEQQTQANRAAARPTFGPAPTATAVAGNLLAAAQPKKIR